jgi:hypothetical protein
MSRNEAQQAIDAYFNGLCTGDSSNIPLSEDVVFQSVANGETIIGSDAVKSFVEEFAKNIRSIDVEEKVFDGENACVLFKWTSPSGLELEICEHFRFSGPQIVYIRPYFDPRPLFE